MFDKCGKPDDVAIEIAMVAAPIIRDRALWAEIKSSAVASIGRRSFTNLKHGLRHERSQRLSKMLVASVRPCSKHAESPTHGDKIETSSGEGKFPPMWSVRCRKSFPRHGLAAIVTSKNAVDSEDRATVDHVFSATPARTAGSSPRIADVAFAPRTLPSGSTVGDGASVGCIGVHRRWLR